MCAVNVEGAHALEAFQPASNALGQNDGLVSTPSPIFTKGSIHNSAHKLGLSAPVIGIDMDTTDHRLFMSDTGNHRVLVYDLDSNNALIDRIPDFVLGQANFWGNTAANTQAGMNVPNGIAYDDANNRLFVTQGGGTTSARVTVYDVTSITNGEDAVNVLGQSSFTVSAGVTTQEGMLLPTGVAYDSTNQRLFVAQNTANRVTVYDVAAISDGEAATGVLGQADFVTATAAVTQAGMSAPFDVALSGSTTMFLLVSQGTANRVTIYDVTTVTNGESAVKVLGQANFTGTTAATTQAGMNAPRGIAYDSVGKKLYVSQTTGNRITVYNFADGVTDGENAVSVLGQSNFTGTAAATAQSGLNAPTGAYIDRANARLYVPQSGASRVSIFDVASITDGEAAVDALGQYDDSLSDPQPVYTKGTANNGPHKMGYSSPLGLTVDSTNHRLFVADTSNNRVLVYNLDADNVPLDMIPDNVLGRVNYYSNALATTQSGLNAPTGLAFDSARNQLFVSDMTNSRIVVFDTTSITDGENAVNVLGQVNYTTATATTTQLGLSAPRQISYDEGSKQLFVADTGNSRVIVYDLTTIVDGEGAVDVLGQDDGTVSAPSPIYIKGTAQNAAHKLGMSGPSVGVVMDTVGHRLFVSDTTNNRILVYNLNGSNVLLDRTPDNVLGQLNFYTVAAGATQSGLETPNGLAFDATGNRLFVAEGAGSRVKIYDTTSITDGEEAENVIGQSTFAGTTAATSQIRMSQPFDVLYQNGSNSRLFVADATLNRVTVYNLATGLDHNLNATNLIGQNDGLVSGPSPIYIKTAINNGPTQLGISAPIIGMEMDTIDHRLFVSDTTNNRILVYNLDSNNALIDRIPDNVLGQINFYSNAAANTQIGLNAPNGLTYDSTGKRLFVAEASGNRVKIFDVTSITNGEDAINVLGQVGFTTATAATTQAGMNVPTGVVYGGSGSRLYVAQNTGNRVSVYDVATITNGESAIAVLGQANHTATAAATTQAGMNVPYDVALSGSTTTTLFVSQGTGNRVTTYDVTSITDGENAVKVLGQANFTATAAATTQAGMNAPRGIAYDSVGKKLYVSQTTGNRVTVYNTADGISDGENAVSVLGQANFTATAAATTQGGLNAPTGAYIDRANARLYVPQSGASRVSIFDVSSITDGENAADGIGQYDDSLVDPAAVYTKSLANNGPNATGLSAPVIGLAMDTTDHRLFVSDTGNNRVLIYNLNGSNLLVDRVPDHVLGQANFYSNVAASTQSGMETPNGIAFDDTGDRLFVAEGAGSRVKVFDVAAITNGEDAVNVLGQANFTGTTAATTQAGMSQPGDVVFDDTGDRLYVSDITLNRVTVYDVAAITDGENAINVLGQANFTASTAATTQAGMNVPYGLSLSGSTATTLFVAQGTGNRVTTYDVTSITDGENAVKVLGQATFTATTAATTQAGMSAPRGITYDATNKRLYVTETTNNRVLIFDVAAITDGENAIFVQGQSAFTTATAAVSTEGFSAPTGVVIDPVNNLLYVSQTTANRVSIIDLTQGVGNGEAATSVLGQADYVTATAATTQAGMNVPVGLALSGSNTLFVSQTTGNRVTVYDITAITDGEGAVKVLGQANFTATAAATTQAGMNVARGIAYDPTDKYLYVSQTTGNRVTVYDVAAITDGENAIKVLGQPNFITTAASTRQAGLNSPTGVYVDVANNKLYVPQSGASRVSIFDITSITDGEDAVDALGQSDNDLNPPGAIFTKGTANNAAYKLGLSAPQAVTVDATNHRLFVVDSGNNRVLSYNLDSNNVLLDRIPDNVLGQLNFYNNAISSTQAGLSTPSSAEFNPNENRLYVTDTTNSRIAIYDTATITDGENAVSILGQHSFVAVTAATSPVHLSSPRHLQFDSSFSQLFVVDTGNNRIVIYGEPEEEASGGGDTFHFFGF